MKREKLDCNNLIKTHLRKINRENLSSFNFSKNDVLKGFELRLLNELPYNLFKIFYQYVDLIIEQITEIRKKDCFNVFTSGFSRGIEFERYLKNKYRKNEPQARFFITICKVFHLSLH